jgi:hypothetical protein
MYTNLFNLNKKIINDLLMFYEEIYVSCRHK